MKNEFCRITSEEFGNLYVDCKPFSPPEVYDKDYKDTPVSVIQDSIHINCDICKFHNSCSCLEVIKESKKEDVLDFLLNNNCRYVNVSVSGK